MFLFHSNLKLDLQTCDADMLSSFLNVSILEWLSVITERADPLPTFQLGIFNAISILLEYHEKFGILSIILQACIIIIINQPSSILPPTPLHISQTPQSNICVYFSMRHNYIRHIQLLRSKYLFLNCRALKNFLVSICFFSTYPKCLFF